MLLIIIIRTLLPRLGHLAQPICRLLAYSIQTSGLACFRRRHLGTFLSSGALTEVEKTLDGSLISKEGICDNRVFSPTFLLRINH